MAVVHIGIGSNLGNREENCMTAIAALQAAGVEIRKQSALYETEPWGVTDQPAFINMAAEVLTDLAPQAFLALVKGIEMRMGRSGALLKWGPRIIDLDILFYDNLVLATPDLTIPHPLLHERAFVLTPLADIAAEKVHPVLGRSIARLAADCGG
jgi:2-amino-4-hydroxy-6-hydroxymethyldihydropteridine diphosphokinase